MITLNRNILLDIFDEFMKDEESEKIRMKEHQVTITNQQIIEMAYAHIDLTGPQMKDRTGLSFEETNCYTHIQNLIQELLQIVDAEYLSQHQRVAEFFSPLCPTENTTENLAGDTSEDDFRFGACPECKEQDTSCYLNIGKDHWFLCDKHRVCWNIGYNLFSSWQEETKEDWERNRQKLKDYRVVEPWHPSKSA